MKWSAIWKVLKVVAENATVIIALIESIKKDDQKP
jgi:hypothetical protein